MKLKIKKKYLKRILFIFMLVGVLGNCFFMLTGSMNVQAATGTFDIDLGDSAILSGIAAVLALFVRWFVGIVAMILYTILCVLIGR